MLPSLIIRIERWKWSERFELYVSSMGNFKDKSKQKMQIRINNCGYSMIDTKDGTLPAHRVVMMVWKPTEGMEILTVDHINHNKRDNNIYNLEWVTQEENTRRARKDETKELGLIMPNVQLIATKKKSIHRFNSTSEAVDFIYKDNAMGPNTDLQKVSNRIQRACVDQKSSYGFNWRTELC